MFVILQKYDFSSKSQRILSKSDQFLDVCDTAKVRFFKQITTCSFDRISCILDVCDTAKVRFFKQITTACRETNTFHLMFVILQKYDFSSKSQRNFYSFGFFNDVCDTAKVRFFKQITTIIMVSYSLIMMFVILQKYDFSSKSQRVLPNFATNERCLWYCKSTIFQANHNTSHLNRRLSVDVCDTAKVRFFKQITTLSYIFAKWYLMFVILQKYDFSSKSQQKLQSKWNGLRCLWYCKSTIFQANHNLKCRLS